MSESIQLTAIDRAVDVPKMLAEAEAEIVRGIAEGGSIPAQGVQFLAIMRRCVVAEAAAKSLQSIVERMESHLVYDLDKNEFPEYGEKPYELFDETITWTLCRVAQLAGVKQWGGGGGSEDVVADIDAEICTILEACGVRGEDGEIINRGISAGAELIAAERRRQIEVEGFGPERDDAYSDGELVNAAIAYASFSLDGNVAAALSLFWPEKWADAWFKPSRLSVRNLEKAGALIAAQIDMLQRLDETVRVDN